MIRSELGCSCGIAVCILMIITCFIKCSSEEKPEQSSYGFIWYSLKWEQAMSGYESPKKVRYCFYPLEKGAMIQIESDTSGLKFTLPPDTYRLLVFNCDADNIQFRNMNSFETAEALFILSRNNNLPRKRKRPGVRHRDAFLYME